LNIIKHGYKVQFISSPDQPNPVISNPSLTKISILKSEINTNLATGAISVVENSSDQIVSRVFTVPRNSGGHRMIIDLSELNLCINKV
jgi:hypothetical protein